MKNKLSLLKQKMLSGKLTAAEFIKTKRQYIKETVKLFKSRRTKANQQLEQLQREFESYHT